MKIWKYPLPLPDHADRPITVAMPKYSRVLHVDRDPAGLDPAVWVMVDPAYLDQLEERTFFISGTGWEIVPDVEYRGTVIISGYVWHVFEKPIKRNLAELLLDLVSDPKSGVLGEG